MLSLGAECSKLFACNRWANARTLEPVSALSGEEYGRTLGGSFPSVQETLAHIYAAELGKAPEATDYLLFLDGGARGGCRHYVGSDIYTAANGEPAAQKRASLFEAERVIQKLTPSLHAA